MPATLEKCNSTNVCLLDRKIRILSPTCRIKVNMHASQEKASSLNSPQASLEGSSVTDTPAPISSDPNVSGSTQHQDTGKVAAVDLMPTGSNTTLYQASEADTSRDR